MELLQTIQELANAPGWRQAIIVVGAILIAVLVRLTFARVVQFFTKRTATDVDDEILRELRRPVVWSIVLVGRP
jgi:hypothetical protein